VTDGEVYAQDGEGRIIQVDPLSGQTKPLTPREPRHRLVAAGGGKALAFRDDSTADNAYQPVIVSPNGVTETITGFSSRLKLSATTPAISPATLFDGERFGFVLENDPNQAPGWIGYYDGEESRKMHFKDWTRPPVSLTPEGLVFAGRTGPLSGGGNREIYRFQDGNGFDQLTDTNGYERNPTTAGSLVYWNDDSAVFRTELESGEPTRIHEGFCGPVDASRRYAAFMCNSEGRVEEGPSRNGPWLGDELHFFNGDSTRSIPTGGGWVAAPRILGASVVWFEYENRAAFSGGPAEGELRYWNTSMSESTVIDSVGGPCLSCGAAWPPINLSADGGVIAWNYAMGDEDRPTGPEGGGGVAKLGSPCR
jgi:hypothetical protein